MSDTEALQEQPDTETPAESAFRSAPIKELSGQVQDIQNVMDELMEEGTHYDDVTGDGRNSLLQPGAEKLCFAFKFAPSFDVEWIDVPPEDVPNAERPIQGHREYIVNCELYHRPTDQYVGSGRGSCATYESKYRYRKEEKVTDVQPPQSFWDSYDKDRGENMGDADFSILRDTLEREMDDPPPADADVGVEFVDNTPLISYESGRMENPDIADQYNTCLKMAEKRALVNAVKRATAASDIFTQDTEDLAYLDGSSVEGERKKQPSSNKSENPQRATWKAPHGQSFAVYPKYKEQLETAEENLEALDGADLGAKLEQLKDVEWGGVAADALDHLIKYHEKRLEDDSEEDPDEVKEAADNVEVAGEDANDEAFESEDDLPF